MSYLIFEQLRVKKEGNDWGERFRGHTDKRPYGPQSISLDVISWNGLIGEHVKMENLMQGFSFS
jgi:hypothetical protein